MAGRHSATHSTSPPESPAFGLARASTVIRRKTRIARKGGSAPATECDFPCLAMPMQLWLQRSPARRELRARYRPIWTSTARVPHYCFCFSSCPYRASALATKRNSAWTPCLPPGSKQGLASAAARRCCLRLEGRADAGRRDRTRRFAAVLTQARPRRASLRRRGCPRLVAFRPARPRRRPKTSLGSNSVSHRPSSLRGTTSLANGPGDSRGPARRAGLPPAPTRPAGRRPRHDLSPPTRITRVVSDFAILRLVWLVWLLGGSNAKLVRC